MNYDKIGPTAWSVAYQRTLADIKYSKEIFDELASMIASTDLKQRDYFEKSKTSKYSTVRVEARYKLINRILEWQRPVQVFEIAAGLSPRGLSMAEANPDLTYVELDLPGMTNEKRRILSQIEAKFKRRIPNLNIEPGDALEYESLFAATKHFRHGNIAVINEGLLRYLNFEQKAKVSQNVHQLLENFGGVWITPDITLRQVIMSEGGYGERQSMKELAGMDIYANSFRDVEHAKDFFTQQGFQVEPHSYIEIEDELVSPAKLGMSREEVIEAINNGAVFLMRIR